VSATGLSPAQPPDLGDPAGSAVSAGDRARQQVASIALRFGVIAALVLVLVLAGVFYPGFFERDNINNLLSQSAPEGLVALGMTFVIIAGGFDLSAGAILSLCAVIYADAANHMALVPAALITIAVGALAGVINGAIVTRLRVNPFVATLGTGSIFGGLAFIYAHAEPISVTRESFAKLGNGDWLGIPIDVYLLVAVILLATAVLVKTRFGRSVYAIGGNDEASRLCGILVDRVRSTTYVLTGITAALRGMIVASRLGIIQADIGASVSLDAIAIVVIGGTSLLGGEGAIWRSVVGLLILATITNVLNAKAVDANWQAVIKGAVLIGAVSLDVLARRYGQRRAT
jgi:ribose transport system permease protein